MFSPGMLREDLIERTIKQLAAAIARILGLRQRGDLVAAIAEADAALASVAGADPRFLDAAEPALVAARLEPVRLAAIGRLLATRASLEQEGGDPARAERTRARAVMYLREAEARGAIDADTRACLDALTAPQVR
jgi:hypothetical protein